jgi:ankyrin repeat protein
MTIKTLENALINRDITKVKAALLEDMDINKGRYRSAPLLHEAVKTNAEIVSAIIDYRPKSFAQVDINAVDDFGKTSLMIACLVGKPEVVTLLLDNRADVQYSLKGYSALHAAARSGNTTIARSLLDRGANVNAVWEDEDEQNYVNLTPLMIAALRRDMAMISLLVSYGANIEAKMLDNDTSTEHTAVQLCSDMTDEIKNAIKEGLENRKLFTNIHKKEDVISKIVASGPKNRSELTSNTPSLPNF